MAQGQVNLGGNAAPRPKVGVQWDPLVRLSHWAVAMMVLANYLLNHGGGAVHVWIGWGLMAVLALRFAWGFVGPKEARFTSFLPNPVAALRHMGALAARLLGRGKNLRDYPSHNPAGAMMVYALWASLTVVAITGLVMTGGASPVRVAQQQAAVAAGDWSVLLAEGDDMGSDKGGHWAGALHEIAANLVVALALIHVAGVTLESRALGRNLVRPMLRK